MKKVLILNYHKINPISHLGKTLFSVDEDKFRKQLELIEKLDIDVISIKDINKPNKKGLSIILTFDDSNKSDFEIVYPILLQKKLPAVFFPIIDTIGKKDKTIINE